MGLKRKITRYRYFISFFFKTEEGNQGVGNAECLLPESINSIDSIKNVEQSIIENDKTYNFVLVLNYKLLGIVKERKIKL